jgi:anthranilate/para-aminobenzoate synthase component II
VVACDYGIKRNILRMLAARGCRLTVVPAQTTAEDILKMKPDGVFLSNGPGDPEPCAYAIEAIRRIIDTGVPVFGICLGHHSPPPARAHQMVWTSRRFHRCLRLPRARHDHQPEHGFAVVKPASRRTCA